MSEYLPDLLPPYGTKCISRRGLKAATFCAIVFSLVAASAQAGECPLIVTNTTSDDIKVELQNALNLKETNSDANRVPAKSTNNLIFTTLRLPLCTSYYEGLHVMARVMGNGGGEDNYKTKKYYSYWTKAVPSSKGYVLYLTNDDISLKNEVKPK